MGCLVHQRVASPYHYDRYPHWAAVGNLRRIQGVCWTPNHWICRSSREEVMYQWWCSRKHTRCVCRYLHCSENAYCFTFCSIWSFYCILCKSDDSLFIPFQTSNMGFDPRGSCRSQSRLISTAKKIWNVWHFLFPWERPSIPCKNFVRCQQICC